jgi:branched-chain amino acid transport system substrate-binding protein
MLLTGLFCASCLIPCSAPAQEKTPIKIGLIAAATGVFAQLGTDVVNGANLYLDEVEKQFAGRKVELLTEDNESNPSVALTKAKKLVEFNKIDILTGEHMANAGYALQPYIDSKKIPTVFPVVPSDDLTQRKRGKWLVRTGYSTSQISHPFGDYAYKTMGFRKVSVVALDYAFGWETVGGFQRTFEEAGGKIIQKLWVPVTIQDFSPYLAQISRDADAVFALLAGRTCIVFLKQYAEYGLKDKLPLIGGGTLTDESVLPSMGDEALGVITALHYSAAIDTPSNKDFVRRYMAKTGRLPSYYSEASYTAMRWIDCAVTSLKGDVSKPDRVLKALQMVDLKETPRGPLKMDSYGNPIENIYIRKVERVGGALQNKVIHTFPAVSQFWNYDPKEYLKLPAYSRDYPPLKG